MKRAEFLQGPEQSPPITRRLKVAVIGAGHVGLSGALLLAQHHNVRVLDDNPTRVHMINGSHCPVDDAVMARWLTLNPGSLRATKHAQEALPDADLVILTLRTSFIEWARSIDTGALDRQIDQVQAINPKALTVIESIVPVGYTRAKVRDLQFGNLMAAPVLLSHANAMSERLSRSFRVVGELSDRATWFARLMSGPVTRLNTEWMQVDSAEAEAIVLFRERQRLTRHWLTRTEIHAYAQRHGLNAQQIESGLWQQIGPPIPSPFADHDQSVTSTPEELLLHAT